ncbi:hypothetical protein ACN47E_005868 [Coniothyrium glycines]
MSDKLMDTEPGGEQTQYEGAHTFIEPHNKQAGQLGDPSHGTSTTPPTTTPNAPNATGITPADKIRYGQSIQEGGMGGKTTASSGAANTDSGFGGARKAGGDAEEGDGDAARQRREQGYGGDKDMRRDVGA